MPPTVCLVIIEPRKHGGLQVVLHNFRNTFPEYPMFIFHGTQNALFVRKITRNIPLVTLKNIGKSNLGRDEYNLYVTSRTFYTTFESYDYMFMFQTDSMVCPHSPFDITRFLKYDYIGAPWAWFDNGVKGGNGGLSLRKVSAMLTSVDKYKFVPNGTHFNEDLFFSRLPLKFPPRHIAQQFSVESVYYETPFAMHKPWCYLTDEQIAKLALYAPMLNELIRINK